MLIVILSILQKSSSSPVDVTADASSDIKERADGTEVIVRLTTRAATPLKDALSALDETILAHGIRE